MTINATAIWRVRPSGSNTNGGGYDPGIGGAATDYSQQNAAQATGTNGVTTGTTTFVDATANAFTSSMVGNAMYVTGTGQTTGCYFVTAFTSSSTVTLDRSPGTGTGATWNLGGGWADFWTNAGFTNAVVVPGNTIFILGSGTPNPSSYTYDYSVNTSTASLTAGNNSAGFITLANDPSTPGYKAPPDTTGGMPCIQVTGRFGDNAFWKFQGLWIVAGNATGTYGIFASFQELFGCVFDQFGFDDTLFGSNSGGFGYGSVTGCEAFSSKSGTPGTGAVIDSSSGSGPSFFLGNNIHDTVSGGLSCTPNSVGIVAANNIVAKCGTFGIRIINPLSTGHSGSCICNNTIDGNAADGIDLTQTSLTKIQCYNNIISNQTGGGKYGLSIDAGTAAVNDALKPFIDYNVYYNNTTDLNAISYGPHDTHGGSNPYVAQSTENYTLA